MGSKEKRILISCLLMFFTALFTYKLRYGRAEVETPPKLEAIPLKSGDWRGQDFPLDAETALILGADQNLNRRYENPQGQIIWLFISYFRDQRYGTQIHSPQNCLPGSGWAIIHKKKVRLQTGKEALKTTYLKAKKQEKEMEVYYWFSTRSGTLADEYGLKLNLISNALRGQPTDAYFVRLTTQAEASVVEGFLQTIWPHLSRLSSSQSCN